MCVHFFYNSGFSFFFTYYCSKVLGKKKLFYFLQWSSPTSIWMVHFSWIILIIRFHLFFLRKKKNVSFSCVLPCITICQLFLCLTHSEQLVFYKFENVKMHSFIRETLINWHNYIKMSLLVKIMKSLDWLKYLNSFSLIFFIKQFSNVHYFHLKALHSS